SHEPVAGSDAVRGPRSSPVTPQTPVAAVAPAPSSHPARSGGNPCGGDSRRRARSGPAAPISMRTPPIGATASQVSVLAIPGYGLPNSGREVRARSEAELTPGPGDVEPARLAEEVHSAPVERRIDAQRLADRLARRTGEIDRPERDPPPAGRHARRLGDSGDQLPQSDCRLAGEDIDPTDRDRKGSASQDTVDEIVDVNHLVLDVTTSDHDEAAPGDRSDQLEKPEVARPVDPGRPEDDYRQAAIALELLRHALALELGPLVVVARRNRGVLACGRILHVSVDADRAAVDEAAHAAAGTRLEKAPGPLDVHLEHLPAGNVLGAEQGRDVIHGVNTFDGPGQRRRLPQIASGQLHPGRIGCSGAARVAHQRPHPATLPRQPGAEMSAREAGGARHEYQATIRPGSRLLGRIEGRGSG